MATWTETAEGWLRQATIAVMSKGPVPRHIAFILDGNRRYARKTGATNTKIGHYEGFRQLEKVQVP